MPRRTVARARALQARTLPPAGRAGRAGDPGDPRRRRRRHLFHRRAHGEVWDVEFEPAATPGADALLCRSITSPRSMNYEEMTWLLVLHRHSLRSGSTIADGRSSIRAGLVPQPGGESDDGSLRVDAERSSENRRTLAEPLHRRKFFGSSGAASSPSATADIFATADRHAQARRGFPAIPRQLLRRPRGALTASLPTLTARCAATQHPLRPRRPRRVLPALQPQLRRGLLLRDRRAPPTIRAIP